MKKKELPHLGSICSGDFGLKAAFWSGKKGEAPTFREIVGWVTVTNYQESGRLPFVAVVLNDDNSPTLLSQVSFRDFVGYFPSKMSAGPVREKLEQVGIRIPAAAAGRPLE